MAFFGRCIIAIDSTWMAVVVTPAAQKLTKHITDWL